MKELKVLKNGVRIISERLPYLRSCSFGIWVESGTRQEPEELMGISHFIEHMVFKGTGDLDAEGLAVAFDKVGGQVNAYTTKEVTCYYIKTLDSHITAAASLLRNMCFFPSFPEDTVDPERQVICEEIDMYEDTPEDLVNELMLGGVFGGSSLAWPILGTKKSLERIGRAELYAYHRAHYIPSKTVISICGSFTEEQFDLICTLFEELLPGEDFTMPPSGYVRAFDTKVKDIEQNHIMLSFPGFPMGSEKRFPLAVMNVILGDGMGSRLFQRIREKEGLCYTVYSFVTSQTGAGTFGIYTALSGKTQERAMELICDEIERLLRFGVTAEELERAKSVVLTNLMTGLESTSARMSQNAREQMVYGRFFSPDELSAGYEAVTADDVMETAREIFDFKRASFFAVGKVKDADHYKAIVENRK